MHENDEQPTGFEAPPLRDEPDDEPGPDVMGLEEDDERADEPAPPPPVHVGQTQEEQELRIGKAEKATKTYVSSIGRIFEEDANDLIECPLCLPWARGFVHPQDVGRFSDEVRTAAMFIVNGVEQVEFRPAPELHSCDVCDGYGVVRTGSKVPGNDTTTCRACRGFGYLPPPGQEQAAGNGSADFHAPAGEQPAALAQTDRDDWGEPRKLPDGRDNPNYGKLPHHKVPVAPYGITANLGGMPVA
jgi:hypothetical protein